MNRRACLKSLGVGALLLSQIAWAAGHQPGTGPNPEDPVNPGGPLSLEKPRKPNIIFFLADDLGYGELGCYGQKKIKTPHIDRLAGEGMRFTRHYSGSPVCAPSRCTLLTGKHTGHAFIRNNGLLKTAPEGQRPIPAGTVTVAEMLKEEGYATCCVGKWGLGYPGSEGDPIRQGFDRFFGYNCQTHAHNHYPKYLWRNDGKAELEGNTRGATGKHYAPDLMAEEALDFIRRSKDRPFFLYYATPVPHAALQVPEDALEAYRGKWPDPPYDGKKGYLPHPAPRAAYAAMVSRFDRDVGRVMKLLEELGLDEDTLVIFSSDNGPTFNGGTDSVFFESAAGLRGLKGSLYEGGIRVPMIARWPGRIRAGAVTDHVCAFWDVMPTLADVAGAKAPAGLDGISFAPTLLGKGKQEDHEYLYWEYAGSQAVRMGPWKGLRLRLRQNPDAPVVLHHLEKDPAEKTDVAKAHPEAARKILEIMKEGRTESEDFPLFTK